MIFTVEQAKQSWCPFGIVHEHDPENKDPVRGANLFSNRGEELHPLTDCQPGECMLWVWAEEGLAGYCAHAGGGVGRATDLPRPPWKAAGVLADRLESVLKEELRVASLAGFSERLTAKALELAWGQLPTQGRFADVSAAE